MQVGDLHVDLRDRTVVRIREVHVTNPGDPGLVSVVDIPRGFTFLVDPRFLSPRALDPDVLLTWLQHG